METWKSRALAKSIVLGECLLRNPKWREEEEEELCFGVTLFNNNTQKCDDILKFQYNTENVTNGLFICWLFESGKSRCPILQWLDEKILFL